MVVFSLLSSGFLVGIIFFILGLGTLLPWNFFMTVSMYFNNRLNTSEWSNGTVTTRKEYYFNNWMTLLSQLPLLLFTLLNSFLYQWISEKMRIAGSLVFILLLFILTAVLVKIPMEEDRFFSVTMATIWFINSFGAVLQGSLFFFVCFLPQSYSAVFMSGQGLAGTFAALAMIFAIASETLLSLRYYHLFNYYCIICICTLRFEAHSAHSMQLCSLFYGDCDPPDAVEDSVKSSDPNKGEEEGVTLAFITLPSENTSYPQKSSILQVFKKIWLMAFCVTFVLTVTLPDAHHVFVSLFLSERYFIPVVCFLFFNVMDFIGRSVTLVSKWPSKDSGLFPVLVVCRVIFVPLLMMCNVQERHYMPVLFSNDVMFAAIMVFFSVSSGYFVCLSMTYAPQLVEPKDGETAGALMTFFLALGLSLGAALSFTLRFLV
uniref:Solute carrier family 29 member 2 n=1 Tax=Sinocyclocheilus rhinocerous TaxID=307959 RepID=A0A673IGH9_9TELE